MDERSVKYPTYLREKKTEEQLAGGKGHLLHLITRRKCIKEGGHGWLTATCTNSIVVFHLIIIANLLIIKWFWSQFVIVTSSIITNQSNTSSPRKTKENKIEKEGEKKKRKKRWWTKGKHVAILLHAKTSMRIYANKKQSREHRWAKTLTQTH